MNHVVSHLDSITLQISTHQRTSKLLCYRHNREILQLTGATGAILNEKIRECLSLTMSLTKGFT